VGAPCVYLDDDAQRLAKAKSLGAEVHEAPKGLVDEPIGRFLLWSMRGHDASILLAFPFCGAQRHLPANVRRFQRDTPVPLRHMYGVASRCGSASMCGPKCRTVSHVARGISIPNMSSQGVSVRGCLKRSAIPPSGSLSFAMALNRSAVLGSPIKSE